MDTVRIRKTPQQQIASAREALQKAQIRQRTHDTRSKIVLGALTHGWLLSSPEAAKSFLAHLSSQGVRGQDRDVLTPILSALRKAAGQGNINLTGSVEGSRQHTI